MTDAVVSLPNLYIDAGDQAAIEKLADAVGCMTGVIETILTIIEHPTQEGGWKLTSNPNDPDGGWTFAGVTRENYNSFLRKIRSANEDITLAIMQDSIESEIVGETVRQNILKIYYQEFYLPALSVVRNIWKLPEALLEEVELSCVVNIGLGHIETIVTNVAFHDSETDISFEKKFEAEWMRYYIHLVQQNAEGWRDYSAYIVDITQGYGNRKKCEKPTTLRASFLLGWFNRIEYFRAQE